MKVAIISFVNPFRGVKNGASEVVVEDCLNFCKKGDSVTLFSFFNKSEAKNNFSFPLPLRLAEYPTVSNPFLFLSLYPYCVARRCSRHLFEEAWESYDLVLFEGEQVFKVFEKIHSRCKKSVIRMHDIESDYRKELARSQRGVLKFLNYFEGLKFKRIEKRISKRYQVPLFFLSKDEKCVFAKRYGFNENKCLFVPPTFQFHPVGMASDSSGLLYFGDLSLANNAKSLAWFLTDVFPAVLVKAPDATITICGKNSKNFAGKFQNLSKNMIVKGFVPSLEDEFRSCRAVICPILYGAGVKIKLLESLSFGKVVIANKKALEGTTFIDGAHLLVADDSENFALMCLRCLDSQQVLPDFSSALEKEFATVYSFSFFLHQVNSALSL